MKHKKIISVLLLCSFLLAGCGAQSEVSDSNSSVKMEETSAPTEAQTTEPETEAVSETSPETETDSESETHEETPEETVPETEESTASVEITSLIGENDISAEFQENQMNLAVTLLRRRAEQDDNKNILISPLSVSTALAMTANGADGSTKTQMEQFFNQDIDTLNTDLKNYTDSLTSSEKAKFVSANSVWIKQTNDITVKEDFLKTADEVYQAEVFEEPFTPDTKEKINHWVDENTDHMIDQIIDDINKDAVKYLINALTFDAQWSDQYDDYQVEDGIFTSADGTERTVSMMSSRESGYLDDGNATGFTKYYKGGYEFVALLPNENTDIRNYLNTLDSEKILDLLQHPQDFDVDAKLPAFESEYEANLNDTLKNMGIVDAFSHENADFSKMADVSGPGEKLCISNVLHKTYISVDKNGTKAAAVTSVEMMATGSAPRKEREVKEVILDRPFVYMIVDTRNYLPLFMGFVTDIES